MSNKLKINTDALMSAGRQFSQLDSSLDSIVKQINSALTQTRRAAPTQTNVINSISSLGKRACSAANRSGKLADNVGKAADMWADCERNLAAVVEIAKSATKYTKTKTFQNEDGGVATKTKEYSVRVGYSKNKIASDDDDDGGLKKNLYDKKGGDVTSKRKMTLLEIKKEVKTGTTHEIFEMSGESGYAKGSVSAEYGTSEAHASISGGFYRTEVTKDGKSKKYFEPGIAAEAGASYSAFTTSAEGQIGSDYLNVHGDGKIEVGQAEGKAKGELGIVDGSFRAYGELSAEANFLKAEGSVGVNVGGIEGNIGGSVTVGVGAHAKVGYTDGVVSFDIGASLGVGFSINVELDVSGAVDAVCDICEGAKEFASDAWDTITGWFSW